MRMDARVTDMCLDERLTHHVLDGGRWVKVIDLRPPGETFHTGSRWMLIVFPERNHDLTTYCDNDLAEAWDTLFFFEDDTLLGFPPEDEGDDV